MAGKPVGVIFVELDLDASRYTKGQQKLLKDATSTTLNIEQNFKNLGVKSSAEMDLMRAKIKNSFDMIANSSKATANDIIRAEEAKNAKLKALNDQQFGAQLSALDKLKNNWVAASAAITAAIVAIHKAMVYIEGGAKAMQVESAFKIMAEDAGVNADLLIKSMKEATRETIDDSAMMSKAIKLMIKGYDPEQIERFSKVVITASQYAGTTAAEAYDSLADAIASRAPRALRQLGAVAKEQMKLVEEAIEAGADKTVLFELAMANLELMQKRLQGTQDQASIRLQRMKAATEELTETIGKGLIWALEKAYHATEFYAGAMMGLVSAYARYRELVYMAIGDEKQAAENRWIADRALETRNELLRRWQEAVEDSGKAAKVSTKEEIAGAKDKVKAIEDELKAIVEKGKLSKEAETKAKALRASFVEDYNKATQSEFQAEISKIDLLHAAYQKAGVDRVKLEEWYTGEILKIDNKVQEEYQKTIEETRKMRVKDAEVAKKAYEESWIREAEGRNRGLMDQVAEIEKANKKIMDISEETAKRMQSNFSDLFFDAMTGKLKTFEDYVRAMFQSIARMMSDLLAQQATRQLFGVNGQGGLLSVLFGGGGGIGGIGGKMTGSQLSASQLPINTLPYQPFHSGGIVGSEGGPARMIPAHLFDGADRLHSGIGPGERPVIIRNDEGVFTPGQMRALGSGKQGAGKQGGDTYHIYQISAIDSQSFAEAARRSGAIPALAAESYANNGILRTVLKGTP